MEPQFVYLLSSFCKADAYLKENGITIPKKDSTSVKDHIGGMVCAANIVYNSNKILPDRKVIRRPKPTNTTSKKKYIGFSVLTDPSIPRKKDIICVYKIKIGYRYYIGSTKDFFERAANHQKNIAKSLVLHNSKLFKLSNPSLALDANHPTINYIKDNPSLTSGFMSILYVCSTIEECRHKEFSLLRLCENSQDCLNVVFGNVRRS